MDKYLKKTYVIAGLTVVFWIVSLIIGGIVSLRSATSDKTQAEISETWSNKQTLVGPMICVPVYHKDKPNPYKLMYVLPKQIKADATVQSETLHRGIFDASVYRSNIFATGTFDLREMKMEGDSTIRYAWDKAQIITAIGDKRGLETVMSFTIGNKNTELNLHFQNYGVGTLKPVLSPDYYDEICQIMDLSDMVGRIVDFKLNANLKGSEELNIAPIGQNSEITIHGNCEDPSFDGMMLPSTREVTSDGFTATWKISSLNRNDVDQVFYNVDEIYAFQTVGTKLLVVGGQYTMTDRALKYAFLVILLSLIAVLVGEMSVKSEINVLNYLLIGSALVLFYLMLLSFGEWIGFTMAYALSAFLIISMITLYLNAIVEKRNTALAVCMFMTLIYVFIYVLLGIEDIALLVGTLGLFVMLGVAMFLSLRLKHVGENIQKEIAGSQKPGNKDSLNTEQFNDL